MFLIGGVECSCRGYFPFTDYYHLRDVTFNGYNASTITRNGGTAQIDTTSPGPYGLVNSSIAITNGRGLKVNNGGLVNFALDFSVAIKFRLNPGSIGPAIENINRPTNFNPPAIYIEGNYDTQQIAMNFPSIGVSPVAKNCPTNEEWVTIWIHYKVNIGNVTIFCNGNEIQQFPFTRQNYFGYLGNYNNYGWAFGCRELGNGNYTCIDGNLACFGFFDVAMGEYSRDAFGRICEMAPTNSLPPAILPYGYQDSNYLETLSLPLASLVDVELGYWRLIGDAQSTNLGSAFPVPFDFETFPKSGGLKNGMVCLCCFEIIEISGIFFKF